MQRRLRLASWIVLACLPGVAAAALDLRQATMDRLDNGLELIVLEEHSLPVVSVQMLYRTGARDEEYGRTGLAHYLEHMAFRATENFPATQVTTRISGVGGEWHGYTWIDQTTYFETLPKDQLDLALRIEADRLGRLLIPEKEVEAERGAVLAELHGYENDPATVLNDAVVYTSLLAHPYRNNTIGWESDVRAIGRDDLVAFYREHYKAANAVLVVVGDVDTKAVRNARRRALRQVSGVRAHAAAEHARAAAGRRATRESRGRGRSELLRDRLPRAGRRQPGFSSVRAHAGAAGRQRRRQLRSGPLGCARARRLAAQGGRR